MKNGATTIISLLLVAALSLSHVGDCITIIYEREVMGRILAKNANNPSQVLPALGPVQNFGLQIYCNATVTYQKTGTRVLTAVTKIQGYSITQKGRWTARLLFQDDDFTIGDMIRSFRVSCTIPIDNTQKVLQKVFTSSSTGIFNAGDFVGLWAIPLSVKGRFVCKGSGKPISYQAGGFCSAQFSPSFVEDFIFFPAISGKDGRFSSRAMAFATLDVAPLTGFSNTSVTCAINDLAFGMAGLVVSMEDTHVPVINSGSYDLGTLVFHGFLDTSMFCKP
jgi:hypothetical protein